MDFYYWGVVNLFSSPYGDCTICFIILAQTTKVFAPLRGWYTKYITKHRKTEEPGG